MSKSLRRSEKWFNRGLWLIAIVFAGFLTSLGGAIVGDLPKVERQLKLDDFMDAAAPALQERLKQEQRQQKKLTESLEQARLQLQIAQSELHNSRDSLSQWLATRRATARPEHDGELIERTQALDALQARQRSATVEHERIEQELLNLRHGMAQAERQLSDWRAQASTQYQRARRTQELRVFGYRLLLTLPLLGVAGWLFVRQRRSRWWPFVWGFILFAVLAFFVELVPYLPSYGGYVRYGVGIVLTVLIGRWTIVALQRYLERQRAAEAQPEQQRRMELSYDTALARLAKGVCPGCERGLDLRDPKLDFCPHCGIGLHKHCSQCDSRKSTFAHYCHACGQSDVRQPG